MPKFETPAQAKKRWKQGALKANKSTLDKADDTAINIGLHNVKTRIREQQAMDDHIEKALDGVRKRVAKSKK